MKERQRPASPRSPAARRRAQGAAHPAGALKGAPPAGGSALGGPALEAACVAAPAGRLAVSLCWTRSAEQARERSGVAAHRVCTCPQVAPACLRLHPVINPGCRRCKIPREPPAPRRRASFKPQRALGHSGPPAAASLKPSVKTFLPDGKEFPSLRIFCCLAERAPGRRAYIRRAPHEGPSRRNRPAAPSSTCTASDDDPDKWPRVPSRRGATREAPRGGVAQCIFLH